MQWLHSLFLKLLIVSLCGELVVSFVLLLALMKSYCG